MQAFALVLALRSVGVTHFEVEILSACNTLTLWTCLASEMAPWSLDIVPVDFLLKIILVVVVIDVICVRRLAFVFIVE